MKTRICAALLVGATALLLPAAASSAGFDCSKAVSPDEHAVCNNPHLSALDSEMTGLWFAYSSLPMMMGMSGNRHDDAEAFLARRKACGANVDCLTQAYEARIAALRTNISEGVKALGPDCFAG